MANKKYDIIFNETDKQKMRDEYKNGASIREIQIKYGINSRSWVQNHLLNGITRSSSEAISIAHKKFPDKFKHTESYKEKMREYRLNYMKEHPDKTAWRKRNEPSYPEKCFINFLKENGYDKKYHIEREYPVFPYYIDFAFVDEKVAIEIDRSQHMKDEYRKVKDEEKDKILINYGWKILRITENTVKTDWDIIKKKIDDVISDSSIAVERVGIFSAKKTREKVVRGKDGLSNKMRDANIRQRKVVDRPSLEELEKLRETLPYTKIGKMYGVSDNTVRKWIKSYKKNIAGE